MSRPARPRKGAGFRGAYALAMLVSTGCYANEDAFVRRHAKLSCVNARECFPDEFDAAFDSMGDCRDEAESAAQSQVDDLLGQGCEYIAENGRECIHAMYKHRKDCDGVDISSSCDAVFVCPRDAELEDGNPMPSADEMLSTPGLEE